jgi:hypothetical protein
MSTSEDLKRAYRMIKRDQPAEAQAIIRPILDADPANVNAWWLLAYAVDDPHEVRHALNKVLELDPNYSNAPKARDMLAKLNEEFPPEEEPAGFEDVFGAETSAFGEEDFFTESALDEAVPAETLDGYEDVFGDSFGDAGEDFFVSEDLFSDLDAAVPDESAVEMGMEPMSVEDLRAAIEPETAIDAEALAAQEEKAAQRQGRGRRLLRWTLLILSIPVLIIAALFIVFSQGDEAQKDLGELKTVEVQSDEVRNALVSTGSELRIANLSSESQVIVAESDMGSAMFVQLCGRPDPGLTQLIMQGMDIAAQQAPSLQGQLAAVGISVNLCGGEKRDTLYRASVSLDDAIRYIDGDLGEGQAGRAAFQKLWKTS